MATLADFNKRFPEFCNVDEARLQMFIDDATCFIATPDHWFDVCIYEKALLYLTAHLLIVGEFTARGDASTRFPIRRKEVDDVVIESAVSNVKPSADDLYSTSYGKQFMRYRHMAFTGIYGV